MLERTPKPMGFSRTDGRGGRPALVPERAFQPARDGALDPLAALKRYVAELQARGLAANTVHGYFETLKAFANWAEREQHPVDPAVLRARAPKVPQQEMETYDAAQVEALLRQAPAGWPRTAIAEPRIVEASDGRCSALAAYFAHDAGWNGRWGAGAPRLSSLGAGLTGVEAALLRRRCAASTPFTWMPRPCRMVVKIYLILGRASSTIGTCVRIAHHQLTRTSPPPWPASGGASTASAAAPARAWPRPTSGS